MTAESKPMLAASWGTGRAQEKASPTELEALSHLSEEHQQPGSRQQSGQFKSGAAVQRQG